MFFAMFFVAMAINVFLAHTGFQYFMGMAISNSASAYSQESDSAAI